VKEWEEGRAAEGEAAVAEKARGEGVLGRE